MREGRTHYLRQAGSPLIRLKRGSCSVDEGAAISIPLSSSGEGLPPSKRRCSGFPDVAHALEQS